MCPKKVNIEMTVSNADRVAFHLEEASAIRSEIAELIKQLWSLIVYSIAISGGVIAWLYGPTGGRGSGLSTWASWVPMVASIFLAFLAFVSFLRVRAKTAYLQELEGRFHASNLGWTTNGSNHPAPLAWTNWCMWAFIITADTIVVEGVSAWIKTVALMIGFAATASLQWKFLSKPATPPD